jgi:hypothetical protein
MDMYILPANSHCDVASSGTYDICTCKWRELETAAEYDT